MIRKRSPTARAFLAYSKEFRNARLRLRLSAQAFRDIPLRIRLSARAFRAASMVREEEIR